MFHSVPVTIPAGTSAAAPIEVPLMINRGTIKRVGLQFPAGCAGLLRATINRGAQVLWPQDASLWIAADGETIWWEEEIDVTDPEIPFVLTAWNIDDTYPHTITWYLNILPFPPAAAPGGITTVINNLRSALS